MDTTCAVCGQANEAGRKFCGECGSPLAVACLSCGTPNASVTGLWFGLTRMFVAVGWPVVMSLTKFVAMVLYQICCRPGARKPVEVEPRSATSESSFLTTATRPATLPMSVLPKSLYCSNLPPRSRFVLADGLLSMPA